MRPLLNVRRRYAPSSRAAPPESRGAALLPPLPVAVPPPPPPQPRLPAVLEEPANSANDSLAPVHPPSHSLDELLALARSARRAEATRGGRNEQARAAMTQALTENVRVAAENTTQFFDLVAEPATSESSARLMEVVNKLSGAVLLAQVHHETLLYINSDAEVTVRDAWEHAATMLRQRHEFSSSLCTIASRRRAGGLF